MSLIRRYPLSLLAGPRLVADRGWVPYDRELVLQLASPNPSAFRRTVGSTRYSWYLNLP